MIVRRHPGDIPREGPPLAAAVGFFDGVHRGHREVIAHALRAARALGGEAWALTLDPHPLKVLQPQAAPPLLTSTRHKLIELGRLGIDGSLILPFSRALAAEPPEHFIERLLADVPRLRCLAVGFNWTFGKGARGDNALLRRLVEPRGLRVDVAQPVEWDGAPISSSRIRQAVLGGRLDDAASMLGRPFTILGPVAPGRRFGRTLGFPTANVIPQNEVIPPPGVYAARMKRQGGRHNGAAFLPAPNPAPSHLVEAHLFDFEGDLYGEEVEIGFIRRLRGVRRFETTEDLRQAIARDVRQARALLGA